VTGEMFQKLKGRLKEEEGYRQFPYLDGLGFQTIGYGRNLSTRGIDKAEADSLLSRDITSAAMCIDSALSWTRSMDEVRKAVLVDMCFNLGLKSLLGFKKALLAMSMLDWDEASRQMLDSRWATQVGKRARVLAEIMRTGVWNG
jgi:lysozyme